MNDTNQSHKYPIIERWGDALNSALLGIHITYFILFMALGIKIMMFFNVFSMAIYAIAFMFYAQKPLLAISATFIEVLIHYMMAVQCVGWGAGFQDYCFANVVICFYVGYAFQKDGIAGFHAAAVSIVSSACYFICWLEARFHEPIYFVRPRDIELLRLMNDTFILVILIVFSYVFTTRILTERRKLTRNAKYDELTHLPNRHYVDSIKNHRNLNDPDKSPEYAIAIVDIDNFKIVNDTYGHDVGDDVLAELGALLLQYKNDNTITARWGGEEFLVICFGDSPKDRLIDICEEIRKTVESKTMYFDGFSLKFTISVGAASKDANDVFEDTFKKADQNLYEAKGTGKNKVVYK